MSHTEFIDYPNAAKAREALVRLHLGKPDNGVLNVSLINGNRTLQVEFDAEPTDDFVDVTEAVLEIVEATTPDSPASAPETAPAAPVAEPEQTSTTTEAGEPTPSESEAPSPASEAPAGLADNIGDVITDEDGLVPHLEAAEPEAEVEAGVEAEEAADDDLGLDAAPMVTDETTRDELRALVEAHDLDVNIPDKGPLGYLRDAVTAALEEKQD